MDPELSRTFSETLLEALRAKNVSVDKLSQMTGISDRYLNLLLNGEFKKLPAVPYVRGYIMKIAEALSVDGEVLWQEYLEGAEDIRRPGKRDKLPENRFLTPQINKRIVLISAFVILVVIYGVIRLPVIMGTPEFSLENFEDMRIVATSTFTIVGTMNPADELTINDEPVYPDENGVFSRAVTLEPGFNTFTFRVSRFLGRSVELVRQVLYRAPSPAGEPTTSGAQL